MILTDGSHDNMLLCTMLLKNNGKRYYKHLASSLCAAKAEFFWFLGALIPGDWPVPWRQLACTFLGDVPWGFTPGDWPVPWRQLACSLGL